MKSGILFLKVMVSVLSVAVIVVLLLFGDSIPLWLGLEAPTSVTQEQNPVQTVEDTEEEIDQEKETTQPYETEPLTEDVEEIETEAMTEFAALPEGIGEPYLDSPLESAVIRASEKDGLAGLFLETGELTANDGNGNIRAEQISYRLEQMYQDEQGNLTMDSACEVKPGFYSAVFTLEDDWGRQAEHTMILVIADEVEGPILTLNARKVILKQGESFQYLKYIEAAADPVDGNINERVELEGEVNTAVPGQYQVKFFARNRSGVRSPKATLLVVVE